MSLIFLIIYFALLFFLVRGNSKHTSVAEYFFAKRRLPFWALSITFVASWWGAGSALSTADMAYEEGISAFWYYGVPVLIASAAMFFIASAVRRVGYLSQGEMISARYSSVCAKCVSVLILVFMTFSAASQVVGAGDFIGSQLGLSYETAALLTTAVVLAYSMFGGFRGVVLTDILQFVFLLISAIIVFVVALNISGGFENIQIAAQASNKDNFFSFYDGAVKYLPYVITFGCSWAIQANVWQRISAARNEGDAKKMTALSFFIYIPLYLIVVLTGMCAITMYDSMPQGGIIPAIVHDYIPGVAGSLVFVGLSAAIMSTMDSLINTAAMTVSLDLCKESKNSNEEFPASKRPAKLKSQIFISRLATLTVGVVAIVVALGIRDILEISRIASNIITCGVFVPLLLGFVWRRGNSKGALASIICGAAYSFLGLFASLAAVPLPLLFKTGSASQLLIGVGLSLLAYVLTSLLTPPEYEKADSFIAKARGAKKQNQPQ